jgi:ribose transport system substrate-binding protein
MSSERWYLVLGIAAVGCAFAAAGCRRSEPEGTPASRDAAAAPAECAALPPPTPKATRRIGFVQIYEPSNPFTSANTTDVIAAAKQRGLTLLFDPPTTTDPAEQSLRVQALIDAKVDAIVLRPDPTLGASVLAARKACIPVFLETRKVDSPDVVAGNDYVAYVGSSPAVVGEAMAEWLVKATRGKATIIEIEGPAGASQAVGRKKGFDDRIASEPNMKIVASRSANFDRDLGHDVAKALLQQYPTASAVFAHTDSMALGALAAVKELGKTPGRDVLIVGIGGLKEAIQHVMEGSIAAIGYSDPRLGALTLSAVEKYLMGNPVPTEIVAHGPIIDKGNAANMIAEAF